MKILMYGWEFPPFHSGGLGVACKGLIDGIMNHGYNVNFVLPHTPEGAALPSYVINALDTFLKRNNESNEKVPFINISPYSTEKEYQTIKKAADPTNPGISNSLIEECIKYAERGKDIANDVEHDLIHVHDWMTIPAGIKAKETSGKPLIIQVHSTEFDRSGDNPHPIVYKIEKKGLEKADTIVAVSKLTKNKIKDNYGINPDKIHVVYNGINPPSIMKHNSLSLRDKDKIVLFLGRITLQKGPDYFIEMAKKVLQKVKNVKFVIAGNGDMQTRIIKDAINAGIEQNIIFTGFLKGNDVHNIFKNADLYVMPSVSEPFGISALEAIQNGAPVVISKQSGVSEVVKNMLKVDFWDVDLMAQNVVAALRYPCLRKELIHKAKHEINRLSWDTSAKNLIEVYKKTHKKYQYA